MGKPEVIKVVARHWENLWQVERVFWGEWEQCRLLGNRLNQGIQKELVVFGKTKAIKS